MTVRRIKSYSADTGYVYQYHFEQVRTGQQRNDQTGSEYVFIVSRDRKNNFELPVFLTRSAMDHWAARHGQPLNGAEQYAAVKMRLFAAFDELDEIERDRLTVAVTPENIDALLAQLEIE